jgi:hypothetical protein
LAGPVPIPPHGRVCHEHVPCHVGISTEIEKIPRLFEVDLDNVPGNIGVDAYLLPVPRLLGMLLNNLPGDVGVAT